jgi:hypothetical protein
MGLHALVLQSCVQLSLRVVGHFAAAMASLFLHIPQKHDDIEPPRQHSQVQRLV